MNQSIQNEFIYFLIIGALAGWLAGKIFKGKGFGFVGNILAGVGGGIVGGWVSGILGIGGHGIIWQLISSVGGALLVLYIIQYIKK